MNEIKQLYEKAHEAQKDGNITLARRYYKDICNLDSNNWEAKFYLTYFKAMTASENEFWSDSIKVMNVEKEIFDTLKTGIYKEEESLAIQSIYKGISEISKKITQDTREHFAKDDAETKDAHISEYVSTLSVAAEMLYSCGDDIASNFGNKYYPFAVSAWKEAIATNSTYIKYVLNKKEHFKTIDKYTEKIVKYDKKYVKPEISLLSKSETSFTSRLRNIFKKLK